MCDVHGCDEKALYLDDFDNRVCVECMQRDIDDGSNVAENFETIESVEKAIAESNKPRLAMTGKGKGGRKGFKINSELTDSQRELINDKRIGVITPENTGRGAPSKEPHLVNDGTGISRCSVCGYPVNIPTGSCGTCSCGAQFGGCV